MNYNIATLQRYYQLVCYLYCKRLYARGQNYFCNGATGNQGGAVARHLLRNNFKVKCLTRHPNSVHAHRLEKLDALIVEGDLDKPHSFSDHLKNADGIFSVQTFVKRVPSKVILRTATLVSELSIQLINEYIIIATTS